MDLGETAACMKRMTEATKGLGQRNIKSSAKDCFLFGGWFTSKRSAETVTDVGDYMIGMVKTNKKE